MLLDKDGNGETGMKDKRMLRREISEAISTAISEPVQEENIHLDVENLYYAEVGFRLPELHPMLIWHQEGYFSCLLPFTDWSTLEKEIFSVPYYLGKATWSFGYYVEDDLFLQAVQWQPLEEQGFHDKEKIKRHLIFLKCYTKFKKKGKFPQEKDCQNCLLTGCCFSPFTVKRANLEVDAQNERVAFFLAVKEKISKQFGFAVSNSVNYNDQEVIRMYPATEEGTVSLTLPEQILLEMQYNPGKYLPEKVAHILPMEAANNPYYKNGKFVPMESLRLGENSTSEDCYVFWQHREHFKWKK